MKTLDRHSAIFCEHANEVPARCTCETDCYCKSHTCQPKSIEARRGFRERKASLDPLTATLYAIATEAWHYIDQRNGVKDTDFIFNLIADTVKKGEYVPVECLKN